MGRIRYFLCAGSVTLLLLGFSLIACSGTTPRTATLTTVTPKPTTTATTSLVRSHKGFPLYGGLNDFLTADTQGNIYVMDTDLSDLQHDLARILKLSPMGKILDEWHPFSTGTFVQGLAVDAEGNIYATAGDGIMKLSSTGKLLTVWGVPVPVGVAVDQQNNVYVTLYNEDKIQM